MIPRYTNQKIDTLFSDLEKLLRWQTVELAVIEARVKLGLVADEVYQQIKLLLEANPPDVELWKKLDKELSHDLNAFIDERKRFLPVELQAEFHRDMTSYDTEEPAFARSFLLASDLVNSEGRVLDETMRSSALKYRYTVMLDRTHGQWAKLRSFGGRVITWGTGLDLAWEQFQRATKLCRQSRISGAIGNYGGGLTPEIEAAALKILGLTPLLGSTQIAPRELYAPLAQALHLICESLGKVALDIRLGVRSGMPLYHEPFAKKQKGSSAMPHKKNTILTEQMTGMVRMARARSQAIVSNVETWEGRAIEQSCVERVEWPDLFHITLRMISVMNKVLGGLVVYPDNMLREIVESRGTYASDEAKNFLAAECGKRGLPSETAYRMVQIASFCAFKPWGVRAELREAVTSNLSEVDAQLERASKYHDYWSAPVKENIQSILEHGELIPLPDILEADEKNVEGWNKLLREIFSDEDALTRWAQIFKPSYLLHQEEHLFNQILAA